MLFNKKLNYLIILSVVVIVVLNIQNESTFADNIKEDGLLLMKTFQQGNIDLNKMLFTYSGAVHSDGNANDIETFKNNIEKTFSTKLIRTSDSMEGEHIKYIGEKVLSKAQSTKLQIVWVGNAHGKNSNLYDTYLVVSLANEEANKEEYIKSYAFLKKALQTLSIEPTISINIQGEIKKKLAHENQEKKIMNMFQQLEGSVLEGLSEEEVISLTGYSNQLNYTLSSKGNPINVQIASRYDRRNDKIIFTIGTPVITMEY